MFITPSAANRIITNSLSHLFVKCCITNVLCVYKLPLCLTIFYSYSLALYTILLIHYHCFVISLRYVLAFLSLYSYIYFSICSPLSVLLFKLLMYVHAFILPQLLCFIVSYILLCIQFLTLIMYLLFSLIVLTLYSRYHTHHNTLYLSIIFIFMLSLLCFLIPL